MSIPVTPEEVLAVLPQTGQPPCEATANAFLSGPRKFYNFIKWAIETGGTAFTNAFLREIFAVGDFKMSAKSGLDTGSSGSKWLLCDGHTVPQANYPELFIVVGTIYGPATSGNFTLPDMRGKFPLGVAGSHAIGTSGGVEDVTLSLAQVPAHTHNITVPGDTATDVINTLSIQGDGNNPQTFTTDSKGGGGSHTNMPPYLTGGYYYIKT